MFDSKIRDKEIVVGKLIIVKLVEGGDYRYDKTT